MIWNIGIKTEADTLIIALCKCGSPPQFHSHTQTHSIPSCHLVWLCTRCPQWAEPGQSQRSCTPDCLQQGCSLLAGHGGCSSSVRCTPFQLQSAERESEAKSVLICRGSKNLPLVCQSVFVLKSPVLPCPPTEAASSSALLHLLGSPADFLKTTDRGGHLTEDGL